MLNNHYQVKKITFKQHCRCFCPIGKKHYTNNFTVTIIPEALIPDYCKIDEWITEHLEGQTLLIEEASKQLQSWLSKELSCEVQVQNEVTDATHGDVMVEV